MLMRYNRGVGGLLAQLLFFICPAIALSQPVILRGDTLPATALENTWFHNQSDEHAYHYKLGKWQEAYFGRLVKEIKPCNALVLILRKEKNDFSLVRADGERLHNGSGSYAIHEGIFYADLGYPVIFDARPEATRKETFELIISSQSRCRELHTDTIDGKLYYCLPKFALAFEDPLECKDIHAWGLLGTNGDWLIEPIYDGPFNFEGGIAVVSYYGQRRKINLKGEFVP